MSSERKPFIKERDIKCRVCGENAGMLMWNPTFHYFSVQCMNCGADTFEKHVFAESAIREFRSLRMLWLYRRRAIWARTGIWPDDLYRLIFICLLLVIMAAIMIGYDSGK